jgi:tRNA(adenine34) deaminase
MDHNYFMRLAINEAKKSAKKDEVPVGAVIVLDGKILARAHNSIIGKHDPAGHAELLAIRKASKKTGNERLPGAVLYATLEPCAMCAGAILLARVKILVYGADDPKTGACGSAHAILNSAKNNHQVEIIKGVMKDESSGILKEFFRGKRKK